MCFCPVTITSDIPLKIKLLFIRFLGDAKKKARDQIWWWMWRHFVSLSWKFVLCKSKFNSCSSKLTSNSLKQASTNATQTILFKNKYVFWSILYTKNSCIWWWKICGLKKQVFIIKIPNHCDLENWLLIKCKVPYRDIFETANLIYFFRKRWYYCNVTVFKTIRFWPFTRA